MDNNIIDRNYGSGRDLQCIIPELKSTQILHESYVSTDVYNIE